MDIACLATNQKKIPFTGAFVNHNNVTYVFSPHCTYLIKFCWHFVVGQTTHNVSECARLKMMSHTLNK